MIRVLKHRIEFAAFRLARVAFSLAPETLASRFGSFLGSVVGSVLRMRRRDVDRHLSWAFPENSKAWRGRVARGSYRHLGREAVSLFRAVEWGRDQVIERTRMVGFEEVLDESRAGGVLLLTGHLGSWEMAGASVAARGLELEVVAKRMANPRFGEALFAAREHFGMKIIEMDEARVGVLRALQRGNPVAILADQNAHKSSFFVPFFGRLAATARGPALFALRSGAPAFLMFAIRDPGWRQRYTVTFSRLAFTPSGDRGQDLLAWTKRYLEAMEEAITAAPEQYLWQHRRWKVRPPEEQE